MPPAASGTASGAAAAALRQQLLELLEPLVLAAGYDLEDVNVSRAGRRSIVRVVVDADGGIDLDAVAAISREVNDALDAALANDAALDQALAGSYTLEVTSPGVDRPLTEPRHWRRNAGRLVSTEVAGKTVTGRIEHVDDAEVTLMIKGRRQSVPYDRLGRGKVQIEFNRSEANDG